MLLCLSYFGCDVFATESTEHREFKTFKAGGA